MRTTLDIDRDLLEAAKEVLGVSTYTEAIETSLTEAIAHRETEALLDGLQGTDVVWSLGELKAYRSKARGRPR